MGSMREARRAGRYPAINATATSSRIMPANVTGSVGAVPKSSDAIRAATANDATIPTAMPMSASFSVRAITPNCTRPWRGTERHANANLLRLLGHRIRDDAVDAERGQQQPQRGEYAHQQYKEAARRDGMIHKLLDGPEFDCGLSRVHRSQSTHHAAGNARRAQASSAPPAPHRPDSPG